MKQRSQQDELYAEAAAGYRDALARLVRAYEANSERQRDLLQEIHFALWKSFEKYEGRCSVRSWVYRVAHNTAASHVLRERRSHASRWVSLEEIESAPAPDLPQNSADRRLALDRLMNLLRSLKPFDRQLMLLYLEDLDSEAIGDVAGISAGNVRVQVHRIKTILSHRFHGGSKP